MMGKSLLFLCLALCASCAIDDVAEETALDDDFFAQDGKEDVYGTDDRKERYQFLTTSMTYRLARSSAMVAMRGLVKPRSDGNFELWEPRTLAQTGVCADERFAKQPEVGYCSATLVAPDLVVTSGHCMMNAYGGFASAQRRCEDIYLVFDFAYSAATTSWLSALRVIPKKNVFRCVEVLAAEIPDLTMPRQDYAILKLDRAVEGRTPVPVYDGADRPVGSSAIQIGHPSGLPQKIAPAKVYEHLDPARYDAYRYRSDVFGGNSGGGVFTTNGTLFGIPTRYSGKNYVLDTSASPECYRTAVCGVNAECPLEPGAYDTAAMLDRLPAAVKTQLKIKTL